MPLLGGREGTESLRSVSLGIWTRNTDEPISSSHLIRKIKKKDKNSGSSWDSPEYKKTKDTRQYMKKIRAGTTQSESEHKRPCSSS